MIDPGFFEYFFTGEVQHHRKKMIHKAEKSLFHCFDFYLIRQLIFNDNDLKPAACYYFHLIYELRAKRFHEITPKLD